MLTFRPITYDTQGIRAFKYTGTSSVREGSICYMNAGSSTQYIVACTLHKGQASTEPKAALSGATLYVKGKYFPIYRESADIEDVTATVDQNDYVKSFPMISGNQFEVHKTVTESGYATSWTAGEYACLGSNGKWAAAATGLNSTGAILGQCIGTYNSTWVRIQVL